MNIKQLKKYNGLPLKTIDHRQMARKPVKGLSRLRELLYNKTSLNIPKGGNKNRKSKKNRQHNDQKQKDNRTNNVLQNIAHKT
jgi:hypothetical protein